MQPISIAVCDDEPYMSEYLAEQVSAFFACENLPARISLFPDGNSLLSSAEALRADVLLLDIQMPRPDGLETAKELRRRGFRGFLIFVTILRETVFEAFEVQAFDYLVKPPAPDAFQRTMRRLLSAHRKQQESRLFVQKGSAQHIVPFADICFCEVIDRKVYLHLKDSTVLDYYEKMETLEQRLDGRFFKCHRSYLVNLDCLKSCQNGRAYLANGESVPVSRLRGRQFSAAVLRHMEQRRFEE